MAKIINGYIGKNIEEAPGNLWADLQEAFEFKSVSGSDANKIFKISNKVSINFKNFDMSQESNAVITVSVNNVEITIDTFMYNYFGKVAYQIVVGSKGDVIVRMPSIYESMDSMINNSFLQFAIVKAKNTVDTEKEDSYGVYVPYGHGSPFNPTPKYLVTDDVNVDEPNSGTQGSTAVAMLQYIENDNSAVTALVPIFAVCSQCVSVNSFVMAIGNGYRTGETVLNGKKYYMVGGFAMLEGDVDD